MNAAGLPEDDLPQRLRRISEGDSDAAWQLLFEFSPRIRASLKKRLHRTLASKVDSEDLVLHLHRTLLRIGPSLAKLTFQEVQVLLRRIACNWVVDRVRDDFRSR